MRIALLLAGLTLISCSKKSNSTATQSATEQNVTLGAFEFKVESKKEISIAYINSLEYEAATHSLKIAFGYPGCKETPHSLLFSDVCAMSYPSQCGAAIIHEAGFDSSCEALHQENMVVALKDEQNAMVLTVTGKDGKGKSVLIDRDGSVKAATTPP